MWVVCNVLRRPSVMKPGVRWRMRSIERGALLLNKAVHTYALWVGVFACPFDYTWVYIFNVACVSSLRVYHMIHARLHSTSRTNSYITTTLTFLLCSPYTFLFSLCTIKNNIFLLLFVVARFWSCKGEGVDCDVERSDPLHYRCKMMRLRFFAPVFSATVVFVYLCISE